VEAPPTGAPTAATHPPPRHRSVLDELDEDEDADEDAGAGKGGRAHAADGPMDSDRAGVEGGSGRGGAADRELPPNPLGDAPLRAALATIRAGGGSAKMAEGPRPMVERPRCPGGRGAWHGVMAVADERARDGTTELHAYSVST